MFGQRSRAASLLYSGAGFLGSVMLVLVWQTPIGSAIEEATGFRPAAAATTLIGSFATALGVPQPAPPAPVAPVGVAAVPAAAPALGAVPAL